MLRPNHCTPAVYREMEDDKKEIKSALRFQRFDLSSVAREKPSDLNAFNFRTKMPKTIKQVTKSRKRKVRLAALKVFLLQSHIRFTWNLYKGTSRIKSGSKMQKVAQRALYWTGK